MGRGIVLASTPTREERQEGRLGGEGRRALSKKGSREEEKDCAEEKEEKEVVSVGDRMICYAGGAWPAILMTAMISWGMGAAMASMIITANCENSEWWNPLSTLRSLRGIQSNPLSILAPDTVERAGEAAKALTATGVSLLGVGGLVKTQKIVNSRRRGIGNKVQRRKEQKEAEKRALMRRENADAYETPPRGRRTRRQKQERDYQYADTVSESEGAYVEEVEEEEDESEEEQETAQKIIVMKRRPRESPGRTIIHMAHAGTQQKGILLPALPSSSSSRRRRGQVRILSESPGQRHHRVARQLMWA